ILYRNCKSFRPAYVFSVLLAITHLAEARLCDCFLVGQDLLSQGEIRFHLGRRRVVTPARQTVERFCNMERPEVIVKDIENYLSSQRIDKMVKEMVVSVLHSKPENVQAHMIKHLLMKTNDAEGEIAISSTEDGGRVAFTHSDAACQKYLMSKGVHELFAELLQRVSTVVPYDNNPCPWSHPSCRCPLRLSSLLDPAHRFGPASLPALQARSALAAVLMSYVIRGATGGRGRLHRLPPQPIADRDEDD
ncbi:hypothetical protein Agub_g5916, partial [Astrephomene gubernaculifera]